MAYAGAEFWDQFFRQRRESGVDLDWAGLWTRPFLVPLRETGVRTVLELGCGTGNDAARLAGEGYSSARAGCCGILTLQADITPVPYRQTLNSGPGRRPSRWRSGRSCAWPR